MLVAKIKIPPIGDADQEEKAFKLMHTVLKMVDNVANVKYSSTVASKCEKNRKQ